MAYEARSDDGIDEIIVNGEISGEEVGSGSVFKVGD